MTVIVQIRFIHSSTKAFSFRQASLFCSFCIVSELSVLRDRDIVKRSKFHTSEATNGKLVNRTNFDEPFVLTNGMFDIVYVCV